MKQKLYLFLVILTFSFLVTACGQTTDTTQQTEVETAVLDEKKEEDTFMPLLTSYPVTLSDQAGRQVTIESNPQRIVSGYYISSSLLIALDVDHKLVGIEAKADKRPIYRLSAPDLMTLPNVGTAKEFDLEGCIALEPDLVILPLKLKSTAETFEKLGIDALYVNPENQALLTEMMELIGTATDTREKTAQLMDFVTIQEQMLTDLLESATKPNVYLAGNSHLLSTAGNAMYQSHMIALGGGENVAGEITDSYWVEIDYEQLLAWDPEYIILASDANYSVEDVLADPNLTDCKAISLGNVYQMPYKAESFDSPVPSGILGSVWLASILHEELLPASTAAAIMDEYYETFYDFTYSEN